MKKTILILIGIFLLGGGLYLFISTKQSPNQDQVTSEATGFRSFFPFSVDKKQTETSIDQDTDIDKNQENTDLDIDTILPKSKQSQITDFAVSGYSIFMAEKTIVEDAQNQDSSQENTNQEIDGGKKTEDSSIAENKTPELVEVIRYVEKSTGHVYEYPLDTHTAEKISNSTIPGVHEALFGNNNQSVLYRYIDNAGKIQSYVASFGGDKGQFLAENADQVTLSPDKENIFYLHSLGDTMAGLNFSLKTNTKKQIFSSDFTEWLPQWVNKQAIFMTTKPSWNIEGSLYGLNTSTGALTKIFGNINGLTTLANPSGNTVLYNKTTSNGPLLGVFTNNTHTSLNIYGLPEKCVWSKDSITVYCAIPSSITTVRLPDLWYQGVVSFEDMFIKINTENGQRSIVLDGGYAIDAVDLKLSEKEDLLLLINKKDGTLWSLDLN